MKESWGDDGTSMTFDRIVIKEGGLQNNNAVVRAVKYTLAALKAGPPYISWHPWKEVTEIWYAERKWSQYFNNVCQMGKIVEADMAASASATAPAVTTPAAAIDATPAMITIASCKVKSQAVAPPKRKESQAAVAPPKRKAETFTESPDAKKQKWSCPGLLRGSRLPGQHRAASLH